MDAFQRTPFPGSGDSVDDDDACSVYTVEMVSAALRIQSLALAAIVPSRWRRHGPDPSATTSAGLACRVEDFSRIGFNRAVREARSEREPFLAFPEPTWVLP